MDRAIAVRISVLYKPVIEGLPAVPNLPESTSRANQGYRVVARKGSSASPYAAPREAGVALTVFYNQSNPPVALGGVWTVGYRVAMDNNQYYIKLLYSITPGYSVKGSLIELR
jgi:hypothetical protein